jgi:hypothetical protein
MTTKKTSSKKTAPKAAKRAPAAVAPSVAPSPSPSPSPSVSVTTAPSALIRWAEACLRRAGGEEVAPAARPTDGPVIAVGRVFGLTEIEVAALQLVHAVERSLGLMARARALAGPTARGITVEVLRAAIGPAIDAALAPGQTLRRHALLVLDDAAAVSATSEVRLGAGLGARLDGRAVRGELGPAVMRVAASEGGALPPAEPRAQAIAFELAREDNDVNRLVTVAGCGRREAAQLAGALIARFQRGVVLVDGEALAAAGRAWETLLAARRDADLDGDILVVVEAQATGAVWRAACAPPPTLAPRPILCVLADALSGREALLLEGLRLKAMTLAPVATAPAASAGAPASVAAPAPAPEKKPDDGFDEIRQMAVRDAERALGIIRPTPAPRPTVPGTVSSRPLPPVTVVPPTPPTTPAAPPVAQPAPVAAAPPAPAPEPTSTPAPAPATPATATPTIAAPKGKMSAKARAMLASVTAEDHADVLAHLAKLRAAAAAPTEAAPAATEAPDAASAQPATPATQPATPAAPAPATSAGLSAQEIAAAEAQPYLEVPADAPIAVLARIAQTSPNPKQRVEILTSLHRVRDPAAMAAMRANASSAHPGVRAVAEAGMQLLFGPSWNVSRPVPKPIQPPPSDDKDRGPPGGW